MFGASASQGYDRSSIMYSPDGRIIQTEYAREAMRRGRIAIGLRSNNGVVLTGRIDAIDLDFPSNKISKIANHISSIFSGYASDGRVLVSRARVEAAVHKMNYAEEIGIKDLATKLANYIHQFTQQGGLRPLGVGLLLAGVDDYDNNPRLFFLNPGGGIIESRAKAIGDGDAKAMKFIKGKNKEKAIDDYTLDELKQLAIDTIKHVIEEDLSEDDIEIWSMGK